MFPQSSLKVSLSISPVHIGNIDWMSIFQNAQDSIELNLFLSIPAQKVQSVGLVTKVDTTSVTFSNNLIPVDDVGKSDSGIFLLQFRFDFIEPFFS